MYPCHQLAIALVIHAASAFSHENCHHHHHHHPGHHPGHDPGHHPGGVTGIHEEAFETLARDVKALDEKVQNYCNQHSNGATSVTVDNTRYVLTTPLQGYVEDDVKVQVRGRVISVTAVNASGNYSEVRELPPFADASRATYSLEEGVLEVVFPVKQQPSSCNVNTSDDVISVPKFVLFIPGGSVGPRF